MTTQKTTMEIGKVTNWIITIFIAFLSWFGKVTYDKLLSMDEKLEMLLVQNGIQKTKIENLENTIKQIQTLPVGNSNNKSLLATIKECGILPSEDWKKKRKNNC